MKNEGLLLRLPPVRPAKLDFFDHPFDCPICGEHIVYTSMLTVIVSSREEGSTTKSGQGKEVKMTPDLRALLQGCIVGMKPDVSDLR